MYVYSNNGLSVRWYDDSDNHQIVAGEVAFAAPPSSNDLAVAFPDYAQEVLSLNNQTLALQMLARSDITVLRCAENNIPVPPELAAYRIALRQLANGTTSGPLPSQPAYPQEAQ